MRRLPFVAIIIRIFHSGYFDCIGAFRTVLENIADNEMQWILHFSDDSW